MWKTELPKSKFVKITQNERWVSIYRKINARIQTYDFCLRYRLADFSGVDTVQNKNMPLRRGKGREWSVIGSFYEWFTRKKFTKSQCGEYTKYREHYKWLCNPSHHTDDDHTANHSHWKSYQDMSPCDFDIFNDIRANLTENSRKDDFSWIFVVFYEKKCASFLIDTKENIFIFTLIGFFIFSTRLVNLRTESFPSPNMSSMLTPCCAAKSSSNDTLFGMQRNNTAHRKHDIYYTFF